MLDLTSPLVLAAAGWTITKICALAGTTISPGMGTAIGAIVGFIVGIIYGFWGQTAIDNLIERGKITMKAKFKEELYQYIYPKRNVSLQSTADVFSTSRKSDIGGYASVIFLLVVFSLPMAIKMTFNWLAVFAAYLLILLLWRKDKDPYSIFLFFGSTMFYLGIVVSYLIIDGASERFQVFVLVPLIILSTTCIVCFESVVFLNILFGKYTARYIKGKKHHSNSKTTLGIIIGTIVGAILAKITLPAIADSHLPIWIGLIGCALLYLLSFAFLQRYLLYKIFKNEILKNIG